MSKKATAPCGHPGTHVTANFVTCDQRCHDPKPAAAPERYPHAWALKSSGAFHCSGCGSFTYVPGTFEGSCRKPYDEDGWTMLRTATPPPLQLTFKGRPLLGMSAAPIAVAPGYPPKFVMASGHLPHAWTAHINPGTSRCAVCGFVTTDQAVNRGAFPTTCKPSIHDVLGVP